MASTIPRCASFTGVLMAPTFSALTRTPDGPYSAAQLSVSAFSAALAELNRLSPAIPRVVPMEVTLTMAPLPCSPIVGAIAAVRKNGAATSRL